MVPILGLLALSGAPWESASSLSTAVFMSVLVISALWAWIEFIASRRTVLINVPQAEVTVRSRTFLFRRQMSRYPLASFQSVYSYNTMGRNPRNRLVLYTREKQELLLVYLAPGRPSKGFFSLSGESSEAKQQRENIANFAGLKDAGFFRIPVSGTPSRLP